MPTSDEDRISDPDEVVAAFHRIYLETLPYGQRESAFERADPRAAELHFGTAVRAIAGSKVSPLVKAHTVASAVKRKPSIVNDRVDDLALLLESTGLYQTPDHDQIVADLRAVAQEYASESPRYQAPPDDRVVESEPVEPGSADQHDQAPVDGEVDDGGKEGA